MKLMAKVASVLLSCSGLVQAGEQLEWPQFRGVNGSGVADHQKPPISFGPEKNVRWKTEVPAGASSPIIVGGKIILTGYEQGKLFTIGFDRESGREVWRREAPATKIEVHHTVEGSPSASTCVTDGQRIISYFGSCGLFCYDLSGKELWRLEMPTAVTAFEFGTGVSPILVDGVVVLVRDQTKGSKIIAVNADSGKPKWERERLSVASHSTPVAWKTASGTQIVAPGVGRMIAYDLQTGAEKWWVNGMPSMCCASPVIHDNLLYLAAWSPGEDMKLPSFAEILELADDQDKGYLTREGNDKTMMKGFFDNNDPNKDGKITRDEWKGIEEYLSQTKNSVLAVRPDGVGDVTETHVVWRHSKARGLPYVPTMICYGGQCVMIKDGGIVTAYDPVSGKELFMTRVGTAGRYYSSPVAANGYIYFTSLDDGVVTIVKAGERPLRVDTKIELEERIAATPAIAGNTLYYRTATKLYAFAEE